MKIQRFGKVLANENTNLTKVRNLIQRSKAEFKHLLDNEQVDCCGSDIVVTSRVVGVPPSDFLFPLPGVMSHNCLQLAKCIVNVREQNELMMLHFDNERERFARLVTAINLANEAVPPHGKFVSERTQRVREVIFNSGGVYKPTALTLVERAQAGCSEEMFDAPPAFHGSDNIQDAIRCQDATGCQAAS